MPANVSAIWIRRTVVISEIPKLIARMRSEQIFRHQLLSNLPRRGLIDTTQTARLRLGVGMDGTADDGRFVDLSQFVDFELDISFSAFAPRARSDVRYQIVTLPTYTR